MICLFAPAPPPHRLFAFAPPVETGSAFGDGAATVVAAPFQFLRNVAVAPFKSFSPKTSAGGHVVENPYYQETAGEVPEEDDEFTKQLQKYFPENIEVHHLYLYF